MLGWHLLLESIGMDDVAERAYDVLLCQESCTASSVAAELGISAQRTRQALDDLVAAGLAAPGSGSSPGYVPVDPRVGLSALVRSRQAELERIASSVETYAGRYHERDLRTNPHRLVEVIEGASQISLRVRELIASAQTEVMAFDAPPYVVPQGSAAQFETPVLARGIPVRAIYATEVLEVPPLAESLQAMVALGEQARVVPRVPMKMVLVDRCDAMLPLTTGAQAARTAAVFVRRSALCDALFQLFEATWARATPVFAHTLPSAPPGEVSDEDRALLHLLNAGLKDEAIARQLGLSGRTLRRRVAELTQRMGATSRFQAGAQAMRRQWIY
ncbi:helix-turn-helix domain-containing protein [Streptomyces sp. V4-01]|uniref:Helix-turn-helix domain-containing protein n=1 Tax=Actinacidiphila polyblastidii TaxID=3110430 RepID=A0ABU7PK36_9ACTN|nr:helix-turn-helix domain-containing protein [Streptomyces sp. V4-01]